MRVYIAGPLNAPACEYLRNVHSMMLWAERIRLLGHCVYVPCLDLLMGITFGTYSYEEYFNNSQGWLEVSDILFVCPGWKKSKGTKAEINRAWKLGIPVVYSLEELDALVRTKLA